MCKKVSVIIPIFNAEKYLEECLNSIITQTYNSLDIILVNDGSSDKSLEICNKYELEDKRVRVFTQNNQGVSVARNLGLDHIKGEYVTFSDSDDIWEKSGVEKLVLSIEKNNTDLAVGAYNLYDHIKKSKTKVSYLDKEVYSIKDYLYFLNRGKTSPFFGSQCNKLYKKEIVNTVRYKEGVSYAEDYLFNLGILKKVHTISNVEEAIYNYRQSRENALSGSQSCDILEHWEANKIVYKETKKLFQLHDGLKIFDDFGFLVAMIHETLATGFICNKKTNFKYKKEVINKILEDEILKKYCCLTKFTQKNWLIRYCYKYKKPLILALFYDVGIKIKY
ncbi:glycosyltransferase family 2 protein [Eubacterium limosum]|jgi:glycosyltransferase involved in cell wall biosynthesis|uniref:Glycosyltransferase 2-like domain-containing protein n=1 Tax=Eubacterium limosum TaxID=1736 RepID=A0AAC9QW78_EUBLI|nr:glycosyltransferase family 2 protein [Eubacterium limosum]ARD66887.1 hypothetical protein B2M23_15735 [Eubacterium limosum]PWW55079.1 cellulose synthase/poly-beta-1,6-N-acetylglucosamine synthase-like glycosyltransferase [Eubacterium limosum]UQZ22868.1 glycosyltransferase [Eubacterium limosum]